METSDAILVEMTLVPKMCLQFCQSPDIIFQKLRTHGIDSSERDDHSNIATPFAIESTRASTPRHRKGLLMHARQSRMTVPSASQLIYTREKKS